LLSINHFENVFLALYTKFRFTKNIEITLEANPCDITRENLKAWENLGINRISI
jgi:oxygen-independent coproporphyrinogen-3 oxidase